MITGVHKQAKKEIDNYQILIYERVRYRPLARTSSIQVIANQGEQPTLGFGPNKFNRILNFIILNDKYEEIRIPKTRES